MTNPFFKNNGPFELDILLDKSKLTTLNKNCILSDIKNLSDASNKDVSFFHSINYKSEASQTKAAACITTEKLEKYLPENCIKIIVQNVLLISAKITEIFYPNSTVDEDNYNLSLIKNEYSKVILGKNILVGTNVQIGKNTKIGHNTIIENNVIIGENCSIGSNVIIRNSILENNVSVLDNAVLGKKGFGFIPFNKKNYRYPHIGYVLVKKNAEIGCSCTIDRGSLSITVIGENTFLDNQVHIAHNVKIGQNCMIAGQVGIAGSTTIGNNVSIGGQAGISGHLKIGDNVQIGGGSGVVKNVSSNSKIMGYPSKNLRFFIKEMRLK